MGFCRDVTVAFIGPVHEAALSIRLLWPFARILAGDPGLVNTLTFLGIGAGDFANPETRLPHRTVMGLMEKLVDITGDRTIGLRAGCGVERGDFDALEYAASSCSTLRDAIGCISRYMCLLNEAAEISLHESGDRAIWRYRIADGVPQPAEVNDFVMACAITFARMYADIPSEALIEVRLVHPQATDAAAYARFFATDVKLGMPDNEWVFARNALAMPMRSANSKFHIAFEAYAKELADRLRGQQGVAGKAREVVLAQLRGGKYGMASVARAMGMSVATLRRRLDAEHTSHRAIVDRVRFDLAKAYLYEPALSIREIAFLLGYSHAKAFYSAFKRWTDGLGPAEYRTLHVHP